MVFFKLWKFRGSHRDNESREQNQTNHQTRLEAAALHPLHTASVHRGLWALPGSAHAQVYVAEPNTETIGEYNAITGAAINPNLITGQDQPHALLLSGNHLFVSNQFSDEDLVAAQ